MKHKMWLILPPLLVVLGSPAYGQLTRSEESQEVSPQGNCQGNSDYSAISVEEYLLNEGSEGLLAGDALAGHYSEEVECKAANNSENKAMEPGGTPAREYGLYYFSQPANTPPTQYILTGGVGSEASTSPPNEANSSTLVLLQEAALESEGSTSNLLEATLGRCAGGNRVEGGEVNEVSQAISAQPALLEGVYEYRQENSNKKLALGSNTGARAVLIASAAPKPSTKPPKPHLVIRKIRTVCTFMQPIVSVAVGVLTILLLLL